jgi:hypothetical protein
LRTGTVPGVSDRPPRVFKEEVRLQSEKLIDRQARGSDPSKNLIRHNCDVCGATSRLFEEILPNSIYNMKASLLEKIRLEIILAMEEEVPEVSYPAGAGIPIVGLAYNRTS